MKKRSVLLLIIVALLPMTANNAQAGRRNIAAMQKKAAPAANHVLVNSGSWLRTVITQIRRSIGTRQQQPSVEGLPSGGDAFLAQAQVAASPRRPRGANPIVILLTPKPVISS